MKITSLYRRNRYISDLSVKKYAELNAYDQPHPLDEDGALMGGITESGARSDTSRWNGVERRQLSDRRQLDRRQYRVVSMLDTRTEADRRRSGRRESDRVVAQFVAVKI